MAGEGYPKLDSDLLYMLDAETDGTAESVPFIPVRIKPTGKLVSGYVMAPPDKGGIQWKEDVKDGKPGENGKYHFASKHGKSG